MITVQYPHGAPVEVNCTDSLGHFWTAMCLMDYWSDGARVRVGNPDSKDEREISRLYDAIYRQSNEFTIGHPYTQKETIHACRRYFHDVVRLPTKPGPTLGVDDLRDFLFMLEETVRVERSLDAATSTILSVLNMLRACPPASTLWASRFYYPDDDDTAPTVLTERSRRIRVIT